MKKFLKKISTYLLLVLLLLSSIGFLISCKEQQPPKTAVRNSSIYKEAEVRQILVMEDETKIYTGGDPKLPVVAIVNNGDLLMVVGVTDEWYVVQLENSSIGCIEKTSGVPYVEGVDAEDNIILDDHLFPEERVLLNLVNKERVGVGLQPLKIDLTLTKIARLKSKDLIENNYFNHYSPTYGSPFEMMEKYNMSYIFAGENLAGNKSVEGAHNSLMESTTHRQNILNPTFTHIGIGMEKGGPYGNIFTQMFIGR